MTDKNWRAGYETPLAERIARYRTMAAAREAGQSWTEVGRSVTPPVSRQRAQVIVTQGEPRPSGSTRRWEGKTPEERAAIVRQTHGREL